MTDVFPEQGAPVMTHQWVRRMGGRDSATMHYDGFLADFYDMLKIYVAFVAEDPNEGCINDFFRVNNGAVLMPHLLP